MISVEKVKFLTLEERGSLKVGDVVYVLLQHRLRRATIIRVDIASDNEMFWFGGHYSLLAEVDGLGEMHIDEFLVYIEKENANENNG